MSSKNAHIAVLFLSVLLSWSIILLLGPLVGKIADSFDLESETTIGNITAIFLLVGGGLAFFWVALEDRLSKNHATSRKNLLILASIIWATGLYLSSLAKNYGQLLTFQILTAVGYAAITPLAYSMAMDLTPPEGRAKVFGLLDIAAMFGGALGFLLSGLLVDFVPWNVPFVIIATMGLITVGFVINIEDPKRGQQERELQTVLTQGAAYDFHISRESLGSMLKKGTNFLILVFNLALNIASGSITYYFTRMMVNDHGFSSSIAVLFFVATYSSQAIGCLFWTKRADKKFAHSKNGKIKVLIESLLLGPPFLILAYSLVFTVSDIALIFIFAIFLTIGAFMLSGLIAISFTVLGEINPPEMRTSIFSLNNLAQTIGRSSGILLVGFSFTFMGGIYQWGFVIMSCIYLLSIIVTPPLLHSVPKELNKLSTLLSERAEHFRQTTS